jgi:hypothetical protein
LKEGAEEEISFSIGGGKDYGRGGGGVGLRGSNE